MVYVLLSPGFEESEAVVPVDLLRRAGLEVRLAAVEDRVTPSTRGVRLEAECALEDVKVEDMEMLVLPGGLGGVEAMRRSAAARDLIRRAAETGAYVAAICAAPTLLAELGLLEGRRATCHPGMEPQLTGAVHVDQRVVVDGRFITSQAAGTAFDFGYALVEALRGEETARRVDEGVHYFG